ncbi:MAG TPA: hypothetical protein H9827_03785 [Candidatus Luteimonas excrementigallinarum]|nr:hypothetical protein [Candidatus Luteimonas excrementigallinarum]
MAASRSSCRPSTSERSPTLAQAAETLEEVHLASEAADAATVRARGRVYLQETGPLVD